MSRALLAAALGARIASAARWQFQTNGSIYYSSPLVDSNGSVYVGSDDKYVRSLNADGSVRWAVATGGPIRSSPRLSPDGSLLCVGSDDFSVWCLAPADGKVVWSFATGGQVRGSPAFSDHGFMAVSSANKGLFYLNWTSSTSPYQWVLPVQGDVGTPLFYHPNDAPSERRVIVLGLSDGRVLWVDDFGSLAATYTAGAPVHSSPVLVPDGSGDILIGDDAGVLHRLHFYAASNTVAVVATFAAGAPIVSTPAIGADGTVYFGTSSSSSSSTPGAPSSLYALSSQTLTAKWSFPSAGAGAWNASVAVGIATDGVTAAGRAGDDVTIVYALSTGGALVALPAASGAPIYPGFSVDAACDSRGSLSAPALGPDRRTLYVACVNGTLYALDATAAHGSETLSATATTSPTSSLSGSSTATPSSSTGTSPSGSASSSVSPTPSASASPGGGGGGGKPASQFGGLGAGGVAGVVVIGSLVAGAAVGLVGRRNGWFGGERGNSSGGGDEDDDTRGLLAAQPPNNNASAGGYAFTAPSAPPGDSNGYGAATQHHSGYIAANASSAASSSPRRGLRTVVRLQQHNSYQRADLNDD